MSRNYKFHNPLGIYFVSFATINWIDVFTRRIYKDIVVDSINYCIKEKELIVYAWVIMSNHVHMLVATKGNPLENTFRDLKRHTSAKVLTAIEDNPKESRKDWMLYLFERAGAKNSHNNMYQFWQQHNQPEELGRESFDIQNVVDYIHHNPVKAGFVNNAEDYSYSSAIDYAGGKGLVNIVLV